MDELINKKPRDNRKWLFIVKAIIYSVFACFIGYGIYLVVLCFGSAWERTGLLGIIGILGFAVIFYLLIKWFNRD